MSNKKERVAYLQKHLRPEWQRLVNDLFEDLQEVAQIGDGCLRVSGHLDSEAEYIKSTPDPSKPYEITYIQGYPNSVYATLTFRPGVNLNE